MKMANISPATINAYAAKRLKETPRPANATVNRELGWLKQMFRLAVDAGKLMTRPKIAMLKEDNVRTGFFPCMTNEIIDNVLTAIEEAHSQIEALDAKATKKRADLNERLRLVKLLASLEKQLAAFGKRGQERQKFHDDKTDAHFIVWMGVHEPERIASARAFLEKHDPALLAKLDSEPQDEEHQHMRLKTINFMFADAPVDVQDEMRRRFVESVSDDAGNLPVWLQRRLGPELTEKFRLAFACKRITEP